MHIYTKYINANVLPFGGIVRIYIDFILVVIDCSQSLPQYFPQCLSQNAKTWRRAAHCVRHGLALRKALQKPLRQAVRKAFGKALRTINIIYKDIDMSSFLMNKYIHISI